MGKTKETANLVSNGLITPNISNDRIGIGTTNPTSALTVSGDANVTGVVTATSGFNLGISSAGTSITSGSPLTTLNFVGTGNTFALNGTTVDISISSGGGGGGGGSNGFSVIAGMIF